VPPVVNNESGKRHVGRRDIHPTEADEFTGAGRDLETTAESFADLNYCRRRRFHLCTLGRLGTETGR